MMSFNLEVCLCCSLANIDRHGRLKDGTNGDQIGMGRVISSSEYQWLSMCGISGSQNEEEGQRHYQL